MKKTIRDIRNMVTGVVIGVALTATTAVTFAGTENVQALFNRDLKFVVNGQSATSSAPALTANNTTYLQLRDVANMLDYNVGYDGKTKTITLTEKDGTQSTSAPASTTNNTATAKTNKSSDLSTNNYAPQKLPITLTRGNGDISVTLKSITKDDESVYFNFDISNPNGHEFQIMGENSLKNEGLSNKKLFGVPTSSVYRDTKELEYQLKYRKDVFDKDVENVRLNLWLNYYASGSENWYVFKVDTAGLFD